MKLEINLNKPSWNRALLLKALLAVVVFQALILAGEYINSVYPIWFGKEIRLKTIPVDPRSMFRGNYARLNYDITSVPLPVLKEGETLRQHTTIYVSLKENDKGLYELAGTSLEKPEQGMFIRGRLQERHWLFNLGSNHVINYGIEAFFAPKERALQLERDLRNGGIAVVMVASNGKATLKDVIPSPKE